MSLSWRAAAVAVAFGAASVAVVVGQAIDSKGGAPALRVVCSVQGPTPTLRVTVANPGQRDLGVLLGYTPGTPQPHVVTALIVSVIRPATGATEEYVYVDPKYAVYSGRKDPWVVPLKPGATYDIDVALKDFVSSSNYNSLDPPTATGGKVVLEGRQMAKAPAPVWTGKVEALIDGCR